MRSECFPLPEGGLPWGHSAAWAPQGAGSSPQGCDTRCPLPLGLPRPHYGGRTRFILQHLSWPSRFPHSLPSPMHISRAADLHFGGETSPHHHRTSNKPWSAGEVAGAGTDRLPGLQDGARWHLRFLATQVFLPASVWPLIFLAPSPCRSSDLFTPARISEVQMYMCFPLR